MKNSFLCLAAIVGLAASAAAETELGLTCRVVFPERPRDAPKSAYLFDGKKSHRVSLPSMSFSALVELPTGTTTLTMTATELTDPEQFPADSPVLSIDPTVSDFYIIIKSKPENLDFPVTMELVDVSAGKLKKGQTLWINSTNHRIIGNLGEVELNIEPKERVVSESPVRESGMYQAEFDYQHNGEGEVRKVAIQHWQHDANCRNLGFVVFDSKGFPNIFFFRDFRFTR